MGNFEKLSVLVIGVIIVMILVVAIYTWTGDPAEPEASTTENALYVPSDVRPGDRATDDPERGDKWRGTWKPPSDPTPPPPSVDPTPESDLDDPSGTQSGTASGRTETTADPGDVPQAGDALAAEERRYTVKSGQTLSHISLDAYGTTKHWPRIAERNNVKPHQIREGQVLIIPVIKASLAQPAANKPAQVAISGGPQPGAAYTVRSGDTIRKIAQAAFGTQERWPDIWIANLERVENPHVLPAGVQLQIPN